MTHKFFPDELYDVIQSTDAHVLIVHDCMQLTLGEDLC